jgi:hypothetical protein
MPRGARPANGHFLAATNASLSSSGGAVTVVSIASKLLGSIPCPRGARRRTALFMCCCAYASWIPTSKRSSIMTLFQTFTKSLTNRACPSLLA